MLDEGRIELVATFGSLGTTSRIVVPFACVRFTVCKANQASCLVSRLIPQLLTSIKQALGRALSKGFGEFVENRFAGVAERLH